MDTLTKVRRATARRSAADDAWREAVREAVRDGKSHRAVAEAAGVSHTRIQQILRGE